MLVTKEKVFKRSWYPVMPSLQLGEWAQGFELLGQKISLWLDDLIGRQPKIQPPGGVGQDAAIARF